jgi:Kdo2-lipid IVA lauroyltransferase/acyltransferase
MEKTVILKKFSHAAVLAVFFCVKTAARLLPSAWIPCAGAVLGDLARLLVPRDRRRARGHLRLAFPAWSDQKVAWCLKENFRHYGITLLELFNAPRLYGRVDIEHPEFLEGRPLVLATGHIGNWELFGQTLGTRGWPLSAVARALYLPALNDYLVGARSRARFTTILRTSPDSGRLLLKAVRERHILAMLIDQDTKVEAIFVPFFGRPASTPVGAARLALRKKLPVCVGAIVRTRAGRHRVVLQPVDTAGLDEAALTARLTAGLEGIIRAHPTQWVWVHRRWRTQAPQEGPTV